MHFPPLSDPRGHPQRLHFPSPGQCMPRSPLSRSRSSPQVSRRPSSRPVPVPLSSFSLSIELTENSPRCFLLVHRRLLQLITSVLTGDYYSSVVNASSYSSDGFSSRRSVYVDQLSPDLVEAASTPPPRLRPSFSLSRRSTPLTSPTPISPD